MKNQLALVQAIANLTMRTAPDLTSARAALTDRIGILAHAHDVLLSGRVKNTTLGAIVSEVTGLHDDGGGRRFRTSGPAIGIDSGPALSLSLFLHELATNSVKYGALSVEGGSVAIDWQSQPAPDGDRFELTWVEAGGPPVREPTRLGSGSRLLRAGLSGSASSSVILEFVPTGVRCSINAVLIASKQR